MSVACLVEEPTTMAKVKRNDRAVKVDAAVVAMAEHVALNRGLTLAEYFSERVRPLVVEDYQDFLDSQAKTAPKLPKPPKR